MNSFSDRLLIGPYLNPSDAARLVRCLAFALGLSAGMLLGWIGVLSALAAIKLGMLPL